MILVSGKDQGITTGCRHQGSHRRQWTKLTLDALQVCLRNFHSHNGWNKFNVVMVANLTHQMCATALSKSDSIPTPWCVCVYVRQIRLTRASGRGASEEAHSCGGGALKSCTASRAFLRGAGSGLENQSCQTTRTSMLACAPGCGISSRAHRSDVGGSLPAA